MTQKDIQRLYRRIKVGAECECWPWITSSQESRQRWNYGRMLVEGKTHYAHRLVLEVKLGRPIAEGMVAMHLCDNPGCCNPSHLREGTQKENAIQKSASGRGYVNGDGRRNASQPAVRLIENIYVGGPDECWPWMGQVKRNGYGSIKVFRREVSPSRLMLEIKLERPLDSQEIAKHSCDNPVCCNPDHLAVGSAWENMHDAIDRGRFARGEDHLLSKLTEEQVLRLRSRYAQEDISCRQLGLEEGVNVGTVASVVQGRAWKHVGGPIFPAFSGRQKHRLSSEKARDIRDRFAAGGISMSALAQEYGVEMPCIWKVLVGRTWKNAGGPRRGEHET